MPNPARILAALLIAALPASACAAGSGSTPAPGQRGVAVATPAVPPPPGPSCTVTLFTRMAFGPHGNPTAMNAHPHRYHYAPPAKCPGPWSRVVLQAGFSVAAGRQYDRTASLWLKGVNLYFGTTQEPSAHVAPHWQIQRNLTAYASLFRHPGTGVAILNNWVSKVDTSVIHVSARLIFFPAAKRAHLPPPADHVYGLDGHSPGAPVNVQNGRAALSRTLRLPRNIQRAYLDVIAQSQATDEQWYMCVDDPDVARTRNFSLGPPASGDPLEQCGNGNFREVEVSIDGQPAGRAPVYPWTYTGGIDPYLWRPTPDIQTLNFVPYRINLTPFAALLDNGKPHTIAVRVIDAHHFFSLAANLLVYLDHGRKVLTGRLIQNTLAAHRARFAPHVQRHWKHHAHLDGTVTTTQHGDYVIAGLLHTSHGIIRTRVQQQSSFSNRQRFRHPNSATYSQVIDLNTRVMDTVTTSRGHTVSTHLRLLHYPLHIRVDKHLHPDGSFTAVITDQQGYQKRLARSHNGHMLLASHLDNSIASHDAVVFNATGTGLSGSHHQHSRQIYRFRDSLGSCYARRITTRNGAVSSVTSGSGCPNGVNHLRWSSRPNAM